jgi:hypothetical protein
MGSSSNSKSNTSYAPSVASTSTAASYTKSNEASSKRSSFINSAKKLLSDIGSPPTAAYDREHGRETEKLYMPNQAPRRT